MLRGREHDRMAEEGWYSIARAVRQASEGRSIMRRVDRRIAMGAAVLLVFFELSLVEFYAGFNPTAMELSLLFVVAAVGSFVIAIPFVCVRLCGVTRRNVLVLAAAAAGVLVLIGVIYGDLEMGHFASVPGWEIGAILSIWILIVAGAVALAKT
jgi:hypothetical protein